MSVQLVREIQIAQGVWARRNFGDQKTHQMILGIVEELGELSEAYDVHDAAKIVDAVGDVGVYMANLCTLYGWDMALLWEGRYAENVLLDPRQVAHELPRLMGKLSHHQLKAEQNIRGGTELHLSKLKDLLSKIIWHTDVLVGSIGDESFLSALSITWSKIARRDWIANPNNADVVAENG